jgi:hypothetical protein
MEKAIGSGDIESLTFLLQEGHNPNGCSDDGTPYLFISDNTDVIRLLLEYGAEPDTQDENGFKILDYYENLTFVPKNTITMNPTKFTQYRGTKKAGQKRSKTRRAKRSDESSKNTHL